MYLIKLNTVNFTPYIFMIRDIATLIGKDLQSEWRNKQSINGILLYLFSTLLVLYYSLVKVEKFLWTGVFWILIIFMSINALSASFSREVKGRHWYYYTLAHPLSFYFSKLIYNSILLSVLTGISLLMFQIFFTLPEIDWSLLGITLFVSIIGISAIFTFIALISNKTGDQSTLMSILSTPLIFPILMSGSRLSMVSLHILADSAYRTDLITIIAIDTLAIALSIILFPILWRD